MMRWVGRRRSTGWPGACSGAGSRRSCRRPSAPLGFGVEGPFLSSARAGAHDPALLRVPAEVRPDDLEPLLDGLRLITVAPELPGAVELIGALVARGVVVSLGHSAATLDEARAGYATHLFNAMSPVDHHAPGLAVAARTDDAVSVELIADGHHVDPSLWPIVTRTKPIDRLVLVSDAIAAAGTHSPTGTIGGLALEIRDGRAMLAGTTSLAGSVIALDTAVRNLVESGVALPAAVAAASRNPLDLLGRTDRGRLEVGQLADLVELDDDLRVRRTMRDGTWFDAAG
jgi:N-acetylglucosamine-6-phosphate deacetylase